MLNYVLEPGVLLDSIVFLTRYCDEKAHCPQNGGNPHYIAIRESAIRTGLQVSGHLAPLFCRHNGQPSFLQDLLLSDIPYSGQCGDEWARRLRTRTGFLTCMIRYFLPDARDDDTKKMIAMEYPYSLEIVERHLNTCISKAEFIYTFYHADKVQKDIESTLALVLGEVSKCHHLYTEENPDFMKYLQRKDSVKKLSSISGLSGDGLRFSLSLLDPHIITYHPEEPCFFILGCRCGEVLNTKYKYCTVTPLSFARDLGNDAKCVIFEALMTGAIMTAGDMERELHLSRNAVARNIKQLRESGIVKLSETKGLTHYYTIDREYLIALADNIRLALPSKDNSANSVEDMRIKSVNNKYMTPKRR